MVIGIVIDKLYPGKIGGAEQYIRNVINIFESTTDVRMVLFLNENAIDTFQLSEPEKIRKVCVPYELQDTEKFYEYYIARYDIQVLFCPLFYVPYENCSIPMVTSILDIQYEYYPEYFTPELLQYRREETKRTIDFSSAIITISEFSKDTIVEKLKVNKEKIFVTHLNSDNSFDNGIEQEKNIIVQEKLPEQYIFYPANGWAHKNHRRLIEAYEILKEKYHTKCKLVLTGNAFNDSNGLQSYINEKGLENDIITLGYIAQEDMPYVFYNAKMLVFPSLFEGFGIPLVEAMRAGTPIACSDCGSIPEIAGDAALYFNANDEYDMAEKMSFLDSNVELCQKLIRKGCDQAKKFSWEECASKTLLVLEKQVRKCLKKKRLSVLKSQIDNFLKRDVKEYRLPHVSLLVPIYSEIDGLEELLVSIEKQEYPYKQVILFSYDESIINELRDSLKKYSMNVDVITRRSLTRKLEQIMREDENGITGILQIGQVFEDERILDSIIVEFMQSQSGICWVRPKRAGFWGLQLHNNFKSSNYQRFITLDQASCSVVFLEGAQRELLMEVPHWYNGHYQNAIYGMVQNGTMGQNWIESGLLEDVSLFIYNDEAEYVESLHYLKEKNQYIPLSIINMQNASQAEMIQELRNSSVTLQKYYAQIQSRGVEFDGITMDGWISKNCEFEVELQERDNLLVIEGENNVLHTDAVLDIIINDDVVLSNNVMDAGAFKTEISIPQNSYRGKSKLRLEMRKTFSYYEQTKNDIRALSIRVTKLSLNESIIWEL